VASVRNKICHDFINDKHGERDLLYMIDDDVIPPHKQFAERMASLPYDVVGCPVPMSKMPDLPVVLNIFNRNEDDRWVTAQNLLPEEGHMPVDAVGTGLMMIRRHVLEHPEMTQPFNQVIDDDGTIQVGQDINFCIRAKKLGFTVGVCAETVCDHFTTVHLNTIPWVYGNPVNSPSEVKPPAVERVE
jgi:GT2 family glycosyltransferase